MRRTLLFFAIVAIIIRECYPQCYTTSATSPCTCTNDDPADVSYFSNCALPPVQTPKFAISVPVSAGQNQVVDQSGNPVYTSGYTYTVFNNLVYGGVYQFSTCDRFSTTQFPRLFDTIIVLRDPDGNLLVGNDNCNINSNSDICSYVSYTHLSTSFNWVTLSVYARSSVKNCAYYFSGSPSRVKAAPIYYSIINDKSADCTSVEYISCLDPLNVASSSLPLDSLFDYYLCSTTPQSAISYSVNGGTPIPFSDTDEIEISCNDVNEIIDISFSLFDTECEIPATIDNVQSPSGGGELRISIYAPSWGDESSWTVYSSTGSVVNTFSPLPTEGSNVWYVYPLLSDFPVTFYVETIGTINDNIIQWNVYCSESGKTLTSGTIGGGLSFLSDPLECYSYDDNLFSCFDPYYTIVTFSDSCEFGNIHCLFNYHEYIAPVSVLCDDLSVISFDIDEDETYIENYYNDYGFKGFTLGDYVGYTLDLYFNDVPVYSTPCGVVLMGIQPLVINYFDSTSYEAQQLHDGDDVYLGYIYFITFRDTIPIGPHGIDYSFVALYSFGPKNDESSYIILTDSYNCVEAEGSGEGSGPLLCEASFQIPLDTPQGYYDIVVVDIVERDEEMPTSGTIVFPNSYLNRKRSAHDFSKRSDEVVHSIANPTVYVTTSTSPQPQPLIIEIGSTVFIDEVSFALYTQSGDILISDDYIGLADFYGTYFAFPLTSDFPLTFFVETYGFIGDNEVYWVIYCPDGQVTNSGYLDSYLSYTSPDLTCPPSVAP